MFSLLLAWSNNNSASLSVLITELLTIVFVATHMKNLIKVLAVAAMILPVAASAATISNPLFSNGQTSIDAQGGSTVSGTFTLTVTNGEVVEWLRTQSDPSQPFVDTSVGGALGMQEQTYPNVPFSVKVPPNTTTVYPTVQAAGIYGGGRAINGGDGVVMGTTNLGTVRVVANGSTSGDSVGSSDKVPFVFKGNTYLVTPDMKLLLDIVIGSFPTTPTKPAYCAGMVSYNGSNAYAAQAWLLTTPQAHFFTDIGVYSPTGNWKTASMNAQAATITACN